MSKIALIFAGSLVGPYFGFEGWHLYNNEVHPAVANYANAGETDRIIAIMAVQKYAYTATAYHLWVAMLSVLGIALAIFWQTDVRIRCGCLGLTVGYSLVAGYHLINMIGIGSLGIHDVIKIAIMILAVISVYWQAKNLKLHP